MNLRTALHLGIITSLGSLLVLLVSDLTEEARSENERLALQSSLTELVKWDTRIELDVDASRLDRAIALCDANGALDAALIPGTSRGYAGQIEFVAAVNGAGLVTGVRVTSHAETPGIGDLIETHKSPWIHSLGARRAREADWRLAEDGGDVDGVSGATITLRGLLRGLDDALGREVPECLQ